MKMLVCTDGSKESIKALKEAAKIAKGCSNVNKVSVIHVYDDKVTLPGVTDGYMTREDFNKFAESHKEEGKRILSEAERIFAETDIEVDTILKGGHPAHTIAKVAAEEEYDTIVIGSRGMGGLKRLFLGSVSNAVLQEVKTNVLVVK